MSAAVTRAEGKEAAKASNAVIKATDTEAPDDKLLNTAKNIEKRGAFKEICKALLNFSENTLFYHPKSSRSLVAQLLEAASELNGKGTETVIDRTQWRVGSRKNMGRVGGEGTTRLGKLIRPQSAAASSANREGRGGGRSTGARKKWSQRREPWRGGKPGAYVSPLLLSTMAKEEKTRQAKVVAFTSSSKRRGRGDHERPWSAPAKKQGPKESKIHITRIRIDLEGLGRTIDDTMHLMRELTGSLTPSCNARVLPFSLELKMKGNMIEEAVKERGAQAALLLRQLLLHPGIACIDFGEADGERDVEKEDEKKGEGADDSMLYTLDFEEEEQELVGAGGGRDSPLLQTIEKAVSRRFEQEERAISPPLEEVLYEGKDHMLSLVVSDDKEKKRERKMRHSLVCQGYLIERPRTASMITEEDEGLPLFDEIMSLTLNAASAGKEKGEVKMKEEVERKEDEVWTKSLTHKASYIMRRTGKF